MLKFTGWSQTAEALIMNKNFPPLSRERERERKLSAQIKREKMAGKKKVTPFNTAETLGPKPLIQLILSKK